MKKPNQAKIESLFAKNFLKFSRLKVSFEPTWKRVLSSRDWLHDDVLQRLLINSGKLLSANSLAAVVGFIVTVLTARSLGPENYGVLVLILVFVQTISTLVSFNGWQAIVKFGSESLQVNDRQNLCRLIKFGFSLDLASAIVGTLLAITISKQVIIWLDWNASIYPLLVIYSLLILFNLSGTPIGILRLFDRFDLLGYSSIVNNLLRLGGVLWCYLTGQGLYGFVIAYLVAGILGYMYQIFVSLRVLHKQHLSNFMNYNLRGLRYRFPNILDYVWTTNLNATIRLLSREADELILALLVSPTALGVFKIAKQFSRILLLLIDPLYQSIYPELTRLWAAGDKKQFRNLIKRTTIMVSGAVLFGWMGFVLIGRWLITFSVGIEYQDAYIVSILYMLALVIAVITFSFSPSILAIGLPKASLKALIISTFIYLTVLVPLVKVFGIVGASIGYIIFYLVWAGIMVIYLHPYLYKDKQVTN